MPRKKAEATTDVTTVDAASAEPVAPRRSGRNAGKEKPVPPPSAPKAPRKKRAAKEARAEEENKEEPAAKKAKPDSKAAEEPTKPESKSAGSKPPSKAPVTKPSSKAAAKPASSRAKPPSTKSKPASKAATPAKASEDAAKKPDAIAEEKEDVEMADKEQEEKAAEAPAEAQADAAAEDELQLGDTLPDLTLKNEKGEDIKIAELAKEKGAVLFLVPKADTPGCTTQACGFRDNYEEFEKLGYAIYCLSADPSSAQSKWQTKKNLQYGLISDPNRELITALGAGAGGKTKRSHLVFEKGTGKLVEKKLAVKAADSPSQALEFVKKHAST